MYRLIKLASQSIIIYKRYELSGKVGTKGQIVIDKSIRDRLGIIAGSIAVQKVVEDHVELYFFHPGENRQLKGSLKPLIKYSYPDNDDLHEAIEQAWVAREE